MLIFDQANGQRIQGESDKGLSFHLSFQVQTKCQNPFPFFLFFLQSKLAQMEIFCGLWNNRQDLPYRYLCLQTNRHQEQKVPYQVFLTYVQETSVYAG
jgi:hypothetical protein